MLLGCIACAGAIAETNQPLPAAASTERPIDAPQHAMVEDLTDDSQVATAEHGTEELASDFVPLSLLSENLWERLSRNLEFSAINNARVDAQIEFLSRNNATLEKKLVRAKPFLFHIADQLERAEIPLDIAMLPLIESAFNPTARSSEGAAGLWQFIPPTAEHYDLTVDKHVDQRLDVIASTNAAVRYLNDLNLMFKGDWLLTLAAYNTGPGNVRNAVRKAIRRGVEPTYWNLKLSKETENYVPRLIAAAKIVGSPQTYDLTLPPIPDHRKIESTDIGRRISLRQVTELTAASLEDLLELNPGLPNGRTPIDGPHRITLPIEVASLLNKRLKNLQYLPTLDRQTQLEMVRRNISNPLITNSPARNTNTSPRSAKVAGKRNNTVDETTRFETHTVQYGDTLWSLSRKSGIDIDTLRIWNNLEANEPIKVGESLNVAYLAIDTDAAGLMNYRVNPSDSLSTIAEKFDLAISDIRRWNTAVRNEDHIQAGQLLRIPTYPSPGYTQ